MTLLAAVVVASAGCGGDRATAAKTEARRAADVKPAKLPPLRVRLLPSGDRVISLDSDLYFAFDSAKLTSAARSQLRGQVLPRVLAFLRNPEARVSLRGYTDGAGAVGYNLRLSKKRAEAARRFLVAAGAPAERISARGFGERNAVSSRPDQALRRVDVVLREGGSR